MFVDDLSVATGRKKCHKDGPSGAHDVSCSVREEMGGEKGAARRKHTAASFTAPFAHGMAWVVQLAVGFYMMIVALTCCAYEVK